MDRLSAFPKLLNISRYLHQILGSKMGILKSNPLRSSFSRLFFIIPVWSPVFFLAFSGCVVEWSVLVIFENFCTVWFQFPFQHSVPLPLVSVLCILLLRRKRLELKIQSCYWKFIYGHFISLILFLQLFEFWMDLIQWHPNEDLNIYGVELLYLSSKLLHFTLPNISHHFVSGKICSS